MDSSIFRAGRSARSGLARHWHYAVHFPAKELARKSDGKTIDLFHTTTVYDPHAIGLLENDAKAAKVRLHVLWMSVMAG